MAASTNKSKSPDFAQSAAHLTKVWKHFGTSAIFPPKMESLTHVTRGGPHFCAHFAVSPPTQVAKSTRHLIFCKPVAALMHSFSALTQSAMESRLESSMSSLNAIPSPINFLIASMITLVTPSITDCNNFSASSRITFPSFLRAAMIKSLYLSNVSSNLARIFAQNAFNAATIFALTSLENTFSKASLICFPKLSKNALI